MTKIVYKNKNFVVIYKPSGMPSQADKSGDTDAVSAASEILKNSGEADALYLVHRLDRVVGGLLVLARNKRTAAELSALAAGEGLGKEYFAVVEGAPTGGVLEDVLIKNARSGKAETVPASNKNGKLARLEYTLLDTVGVGSSQRSLVLVKLHTGRFHQIRAQFSLRGMPLVGDGKYGSHDRGAHAPALFACRISFEGLSGSVDVGMLPDISSYPWNLFAKEKYGLSRGKQND